MQDSDPSSSSSSSATNSKASPINIAPIAAPPASPATPVQFILVSQDGEKLTLDEYQQRHINRSRRAKSVHKQSLCRETESGSVYESPRRSNSSSHSRTRRVKLNDIPEHAFSCAFGAHPHSQESSPTGNKASREREDACRFGEGPSSESSEASSEEERSVESSISIDDTPTPAKRGKRSRANESPVLFYDPKDDALHEISQRILGKHNQNDALIQCVRADIEAEEAEAEEARQLYRSAAKKALLFVASFALFGLYAL